MDTYSQLKEGMKWMWSLGDYREVAPRLRPYAEALVEVCTIRPGMQVLDVAAGDGNFAIAAGARGAAVTATDMTPKMVEMGRARSAAEGVAIDWLEADAEELPFAADRFDVVASVFGAMFAPRPERVAAELFRVVKPGGLVAMANYANEGFLARFAELISSYAPPAPVPLASPFLWGEAGVVHSRLERLASSIDVERRTGTFEFDSLEEGLAYWERTNGPQIALRTMLTEEAYQAMRERAGQLSRELNRARDGRLLLDFEFALVLACKAEPPGQPTSQGGDI